MRDAIGLRVAYAGVFDRDYRTNSETSAFVGEVSKFLNPCHVLLQKELENYLLVPAVLDRAIRRAVDDRETRSGSSVAIGATAEDLLTALTENFKAEVHGQWVAAYMRDNRGSGKDNSAVAILATTDFEARWANLVKRLEIVPGKDVFNALVTELQRRYGVNLRLRDVVDSFRKTEVPPEIEKVLAELDRFRLRSP